MSAQAIAAQCKLQCLGELKHRAGIKTGCFRSSRTSTPLLVKLSVHFRKTSPLCSSCEPPRLKAGQVSQSLEALLAFLPFAI